jgi:hypothetical protein
MASLKSIENLNLAGKLNEIYERVTELQYGKPVKAIILFMLKHDHMARPDFLSLDENILYDGFSLKNYRLVNEAFLFDEFTFTRPEIEETPESSIEKSIDAAEVEASKQSESKNSEPEIKSMVKYKQV